MHKLIATTAALALFSGASQALPHGKPGLWSITTSVKMAHMPQIPPEVQAMMKQRGMKMPGSGEPITSQICMTQEDVMQGSKNALQAHNDAHVQCTPRLVSETASSLVSEVTCHGEMEGTGRSQLTWRGDSHYDGDYNFKGVMHGQANETNTHFIGDFVKADCGAVKPFHMPAH